jgi:CRP-like cAMP-binding protein
MSNIHKLDSLLAEHSFFKGFDPAYLELIAGCASNVKFAAGERIFREGDSADRFFLIRFGRVAVEVFAPGKGAVAIQTLGENDVLGWSWLLPPYRWHHDAKALELTRAIAFDGTCLRGKLDDDPRLGYQLMTHFAQVIVARLQSAQVQLLDLYGEAKHA